MGVKRPRCFFDVSIGGIPVGRVVMQLYADICPKTCENFRALCTGEMGIGKVTGKPLHYQGTTFHRVVRSFMVQSGDFSDGNGKGGESIYNGMFEDEGFDMKHEEPFLLSMANKGPNTNGSQFFITTAPAPHLDGVHVVFGQVIAGKEVVKEIEELQVDKKSRPLQDARIVKCGELIPKKKQAESSDDESSSSSSSDEEEKIKRRLKKQKKKAKKAAKKAAKEKEDGEIDEGEAHPLVQVSSIDPDSIPDVPTNRFLDRAPPDRDRDDDRGNGDRHEASKRVVGGKKVKGRGMMMYRKDGSRSRSRGRRSRSRSRSRDRRRNRERSATPPHWKQAERRTISLKEYEKNKKEMERKDQERARREEERRERHLARKAEDERQAREKEKRKLAEAAESRRNEEARKERRFREERKNDESMDYDKLDFDPEDGDDEDALRLRALETQAKKLIPNYGSPPRPRSSSEDSSKQATTSKHGGRRAAADDSSSDSSEDDRDVKRRRNRDRSESPSPIKKTRRSRSRSRKRKTSKRSERSPKQRRKSRSISRGGRRRNSRSRRSRS